MISEMKKGVLFIVLMFVAWGSYGQGWEWMRGSQNGESHGLYVATDKNENVYNVGECWFTGNFGPYTYSVGSKVYMPLVKYDSSGNVSWLVMASHAIPAGLTTDLYGNEYLLAAYLDTVVNFGGHTLSNPHYDSPCYFIAKINALGNVLWMKRIGNANGFSTNIGQLGNCITTDVCGDIYFTLGFSNNLILGDDTLVNAGNSDVLLAKFDSSGNKIWAKSFGGNGYDLASGISTTHSGNIYLAGMFKSDSMRFNTTILSDTLISRNYWSMFLVKLDNSGNPIWAKTNNGSVDCEAYGLVVDKSENAFITGTYFVGYHPSASVLFNTIVLPIAPSFQVYDFLTKYDSSGNPMWAKCVQGKYLISYGVVVDPSDNVWIHATNLSYVQNASIYDTIDGHILAAPAINYNPGFIAGWNNLGTFLTSTALSSGANSNINGIASDRGGNIYVTAHSVLDTFFLAGDSLYNTTGPVYMGHPYNMFVAKYNPNLGCPYKTYMACTIVPTEKLEIRNSDKLVSIYPNPTNNECTISYYGFLPKNANVTIYDLAGRLIHTYPLTSSETTISIADLSPGMYVCRIDVDGSGGVSKKLVVMR
jgi:Secretion system C-terminal sorting domain